ncbi:MAG: hypothetical protein SV062_12870, partial [Thermodesulfobacteriota bacterium]|nr:hypothetical protein [Thermodesulfobacteriota bacterium]
FLVEKKDANGRRIIQCPKAGCHYHRYSSGQLTPINSLTVPPSQKAPKIKKVLVKAKGGRQKPTRKIVRKVVRVKAK